MSVIKPSKSPLMGDMVMYRMEEKYYVAFIVELPPGHNVNLTEQPAQLAVFNTLACSIDFVEAVYGIDNDQWVFRGDFGIR